MDMTPAPLKWCSNPSILRMHKIRLYCHIGLALMSIVLLLATSIVLAYSIKMYHGTFLHSIPELMTAASVSLIVIGMAWLPSNEVPGAYGLECMRYVWQEIAWSGALSLGIFGGLASLHRSTPGLMTSCGRYFICRGYIFIFVGAWLSWLLITIPTVLLVASAIYQSTRRPVGQPVWMWDIERFEYFWPGLAHLRFRKSGINPSDLPRVQPDLMEIQTGGSGIPFDDEKRKTHAGFGNF